MKDFLKGTITLTPDQVKVMRTREYHEGYLAGMDILAREVTVDCPYDDSTPSWDLWHAGCDDAIEDHSV